MKKSRPLIATSSCGNQSLIPNSLEGIANSTSKSYDYLFRKLGTNQAALQLRKFYYLI
jgi:hypothetical protein